MRVYERVLGLCGLLAGAAFALMAVATAWDVFARNVLGTSVRGLVDVVEYGLLGATFLAAPWVLRQGGRVQVDFVVDARAPRPGAGCSASPTWSASRPASFCWPGRPA